MPAAKGILTNPSFPRTRESLYLNPMFVRGGCVYILTNKNHTVLYTGVTANISARLFQHRTKFFPKAFTSKYNCDKLVYYEAFHSIEEAILREKALKKWNRAWKEELINSVNPDWKDLSSDFE